MKRILAVLLVLAAAPLSGAGAAPGDPESLPTLIKLTRVHFNGLTRLTPEQVLSAAGLRRGEMITDVELRDLSSRLVRTGLFNRVGNRYLITGIDMEIQFDVEEALWGVEIQYDNFVWFSDEELSAAVAARLPTFDGTAPVTGSVVNRISQTLQGLLASKGLPGQVSARTLLGEKNTPRAYVFGVDGVDIPVCRFVFPGADATRGTELVEQSATLIGEPYSRHQLRGFAPGLLMAVYGRRGFVAARFEAEQVSLGSDPTCGHGVTITMPVREGSVHSWERARWSGNTVLPVEQLDALLGMQRGEIADQVKMQEGLKSVRAAYGAEGYIDATCTSEPEVLPEGPRAIFDIRIKEGPQFRMGKFQIEGLPDELADQLVRQWRLAPGAVYDDSYLYRFLRTAVLSREDVPRDDNLEIIPDHDRESLTVDITIRVRPGSSRRP